MWSNWPKILFTTTFRDFGSLLYILNGANPLSMKLDFISGKAKVPLDNKMCDEAEDHISFINKMRL